jgi:hypothetical protein
LRRRFSRFLQRLDTPRHGLSGRFAAVAARHFVDQGLTGSPQCEDFAAELLNLAETSVDLDIRAPWAELHALRNRRQAPPPVLLMFVVSGDFDAVMVWSQQFRMRLGIRAADILKQIAGDVEDADHEGKLPSGLAKYLGRTFAIPYKRECVVTGLASSPVPC